MISGRLERKSVRSWSSWPSQRRVRVSSGAKKKEENENNKRNKQSGKNRGYSDDGDAVSLDRIMCCLKIKKVNDKKKGKTETKKDEKVGDLKDWTCVV